MTCPQYLNLYHSEPGRCLDPEAELRRYNENENTSEAKAAERDARLLDRFADIERLTASQTRRWRAPVDILED